MRAKRRHRHMGRPRTLRRRLFFTFLVTIVVSAAAAAGVSRLLSEREVSFRDRVAGAQSFISHRFARLWHDQSAREDLVADVHRDLQVALTVSSSDGTVMQQVGSCTGKQWPVAVTSGGVALGKVHVCPPQSPFGWPQGAAALLFLAALWWSAGRLARRLVRPLEHVASVAERIGAGDLGARAGLTAGQGEVGALATAFDRMAGRIEEQVNDQRELLATVSHELRTPLGHMRILAETATDAHPDVKQLPEIEEEIAEMDELVGDLLANAKVDFARVDVAQTDVEALARAVLDRAGESRDLLKLPDGPLTVDIDVTLVRRALANLLRNACAHGGGVAALVVYRHADGALFEVHDAGSGFDPALREQLCAPFVGSAGAHSALGLGLSIVRRIARAHGGETFARNLEGGGASFGFSVRGDAGVS